LTKNILLLTKCFTAKQTL